MARIDFGWCYFIRDYNRGTPPKSCRWCGAPLWITGCNVVFCPRCDTTRFGGAYLSP